MKSYDLQNGSFSIPLASTWIGYSIYGKGPACVVCPVPWGISFQLWKTILSLSRFLTLVFVDPRGVGSSGPVTSKSDYGIPVLVEDIDAVRKYLEIPSWSLLGQSAAGFTALEYSLAFTQSTEKLVIVCSAPSGHFHKGTIRDRSHPRYGEIRETFERMRKNFSKENFRSYMREVYSMDIQNMDAINEEKEMFNENDLSLERYKYFATVELNRYDVTEKLTSIVQPTLIMAGKHDIHVSPALSELMAERIPHSHYVLMEQSGHFPWLDEPDKFIHVVKGFILGGGTGAI
jgi:proline iminopeptidase